VGLLSFLPLTYRRMLHQVSPDGEAVELALKECANSIGRRANNGLLVHVEACIDHARYAGEPLIFLKDPVILGIGFTPDELGASRSIDVDGRRAIFSHPVGAVEGDSHELSRVLGAGKTMVALMPGFPEGHRCERHELRAAEPFVEPLVHLGLARMVENRAV